jgi:hypothetical protein
MDRIQIIVKPLIYSTVRLILPFLFTKSRCLARFYSFSRPIFLLAILALFSLQGLGQSVTIHGTVYNMYKTRPLEAVTVLCNCGRGTITDSNGNYMIRVDEGDSLRFSYLGRTTQMFPVTIMNPTTGFDIALHVNPTQLGEVRVAPKNYKLDSIQNRKDYEKIFDFRKPGLSLSDGSTGGGVGVDLDELINVFRFKRTRRLLAFQERLVEDEHDKFIDHRFSRYIVKKITGLDGDLQDSFMRRYRPSYEFTKATSDYEFYDYIKLAYYDFQRTRGIDVEPHKESDQQDSLR